MNVNCSHCATVFRVDPRKIPARGVRARCSVCEKVFEISSPSAAAEPSPVVATRQVETDEAESQGGFSHEREMAAGGTAVSSLSAAPSPFSFGATDPEARARRLARALISDIVTYHPERRDEALRAGTLKRDFGEEIRKSWEEYVEQVGVEVARGTPHFRNALNDVLARGEKIF